MALLNHRPLLFSPLAGRFKVNHGVPPSFINFYIVHIDRLLFSAFFYVCEMLVCFVIAFVQFFSHRVLVFVLLSKANSDAAGLLWYFFFCVFPLRGGVAWLVMLQIFPSTILVAPEDRKHCRFLKVLCGFNVAFCSREEKNQ